MSSPTVQQVDSFLQALKAGGLEVLCSQPANAAVSQPANAAVSQPANAAVSQPANAAE